VKKSRRATAREQLKVRPDLLYVWARLAWIIYDLVSADVGLAQVGGLAAWSRRLRAGMATARGTSQLFGFNARLSRQLGGVRPNGEHN